MTERAEAIRIVEKIRDQIAPKVNGVHIYPPLGSVGATAHITSDELVSLHNANNHDIPGIEFTPLRVGVVAEAFGGDIVVP